MRMFAALLISAVVAFSEATAGTLPLMGAGPSAGGEPFTPADLPNLIVWYEADREVYTDTGCSTPATNSQTVACWGDLGPNNDDLLQSVSGERPTYLSSGMNGRPAIDFNAADEECLITGYDAITSLSGADASALIVLDMDAATGGFGRGTSFSAGFQNDSDAGSLIVAMRNGAADQLESFRNGAVGVQSFAPGTPRSFTVVYDGANGTTRINNSSPQVTANTDTFAPSGAIAVGTGVANDQVCNSAHFDGRICLVVYTMSELTSGELDQLQTYAEAECGL